MVIATVASLQAIELDQFVICSNSIFFAEGIFCGSALQHQELGYFGTVCCMAPIGIPGHLAEGTSRKKLNIDPSFSSILSNKTSSPPEGG